jgi:plasmid stabilization system protein ParE
MTFRVKVSSNAESEAEEILEWLLSQHAGETSLRWFLRLEEAMQSLAALPGRCPIASESSRFPFEVRQLLYGSKPHLYRILFTIDGETVNILHIRHGRRQPVKQ